MQNLDQELGKYPPQFMEALILRVSDYTYDQISETTGVKKGTVKSRISRARDSFKECLERSVVNTSKGQAFTETDLVE